MISSSPPCHCQHFKSAHDETTGSCGYCTCNAFRDATSEYTAELRDLGSFALEAAKRELEKTRTVRPFFVIRFPDNRLDTLKLPREFMTAFNSRSGRDVVYAAVRAMAEMWNLTAVIVAGDAWFGRATEQGRMLSEEQFLAICGRNNGFADAVAQGLVERAEAIVVTVQTPKRVMMLTQAYQLGEKVIFQEQLLGEVDADRYIGSAKMFGTEKGARAHAFN